jgi:ParB/RepB/Spo0J family partition protein
MEILDSNELLERYDAGDISSTKRNDVLHVDFKLLSPAPDPMNTGEDGLPIPLNTRDFDNPTNIKHIEELAASIKEKGVVVPLSCYREPIGKDKNSKNTIYRYYITNGECRYRACKLLLEQGIPVKRVPVILIDSPNNLTPENLLVNMIVTNTGKNFEPIELAKSYIKLINVGWTHAEVAQTVGKSVQHVNDTLNLLGYSKEIQVDLATKALSAHSIKKIANIVKNKEEKNGVKSTLKIRQSVEERYKKIKEFANQNSMSLSSAIRLEEKQSMGDDNSLEQKLLKSIELVLETLPALDGLEKAGTALFDVKNLLEAGHSIQVAIKNVFTGGQLPPNEFGGL